MARQPNLNSTSALPALFLRKLESIRALSHVEREALHQIQGTCVSMLARQDISRAGDRPPCINILVDGFACRYVLLPDGKRQITFVHIPGDILDLQSVFLPIMDYNVCTFVQSQLLAIPHAAMLDLFLKHPRIGHLFWRETLIYAAIFREWMVGMGRRKAYARIAHFFCELIVRMQAAGLAREHEIDMPLTQIDIGDALGLSFVHVNRTLQQLRGAGLIELTRGRLRAIDWSGLCKAADFDPSYLQQQRVA
jgi:CRP-like cAMP-binding protein